MKAYFKMEKTQYYAILWLLLVFCIDLLVPLGVAVGVLYLFIFLIIKRQTKKVIIAYGAVAFVLIIVDPVVNWTRETSWMVVANRIISEFAVVANSWVTIKRRDFYEKNQQKRRRAQEKILLKKNQLKFFIEFSPVAIAMVDMEMRYISTSKFWILLYELGEQNLAGKSYYDQFYEITEDQKELHRRCLAGEILRNEEDFFIRQNGSIEWIKWEIRPWYKNAEEIGGLVIFTESITEQKTVKEELIRAKEDAEQAAIAKANFLSAMSHEIRTPMNAVIGFTTLLLQNARDDQYECLKMLKFSGDNLLVLVNDILDFSKIEAGKINLEKVEFNVSELIHNIQRELNEIATDKGILFDVHIDERVPEIIIGDSFRLGQILTNLASNAIKFTDSGKVIISAAVVSKSREVTDIVFKVKDTGIGIHKDQHQSIFESFTQASSDTSRKYGGTGLGLAISKRLVELQGGIIKLDSVQGKGSIFSFNLKFRNRKCHLETKVHFQSNVRRQKLNGTSILIVDDNMINVLLVKQFFKQWCIESDMAENGLIAVEKVKQKDYNLVLMDLQMPEMDGFQATEEIRKMKDIKYQKLPIIALTASVMTEVKDKVFKCGMNDFIIKPFNHDELFDKISFHKKSYMDTMRIKT